MHNFSPIALSLLVALILTILPLPIWMMWVSPPWILLVLIYWVLHDSYRVGVGMAWGMGMLMDLLCGTLLGEHALALTIVIYIVLRMRMRLCMYPLLQQGASIFCFTLLYLFILYTIQGFLNAAPGSALYWVAALSSLLCWPWVVACIRR